MKKGNIFKFIKRSFVVLLCAVLLFVCVISSSSNKVKAEPVSIAVSAIAALVSFMAASGVAVTTSSMNQGSLVNTYNDLANEYSSSTGAPTLEQATAAKNALNYYYNDKAGEALISMGDSVAGWFNGFKSWFVQNFGLTNNNETVVISETKISFESGDYPIYSSLAGFVGGKVPISAVPVVPGSTQIITVNSNLIVEYQFSAAYVAYGYTLMDAAVRSLNGQGQQIAQHIHRYYRANAQGNFSHIKAILTENSSHQVGTAFVPDDSGNYTTGNYGIMLPVYSNEFNVSNIGLSGSLTDGYDDFEQALSDARSDAGTNGQVAVNTGEVAVDKPYTQEGIINGILDNALANTATGTLVGGYADEKEVEEETDMEKVPSYAEIGEGIVVVDGLEDFFPFCIPFDLIALIDKFNVSPEAPVIHWNMSFAGLFSDEELVLDFSGWETAAMIFRICCLIGFCIFLILKTRDMIRG